MQISTVKNITNTSFGSFHKDLRNKMLNAIYSNNSSQNSNDVRKTDDYKNYSYIQRKTKNSLLYEYNIRNKIGFIFDLKGYMKCIDISKAYKEKNQTSRYIKIIQIIADYIKNYNENSNDD